MRRGIWIPVALAAAIVAAAAFWVELERGGEERRVIEPGTPIRDGETAELRFDDETWTLSRRETTREESLRGVRGDRSLPEPDPAGAVVRPSDESARSLDGLARDAWLAGDPEQALALFERAVEADPDDWVPRAHLGRLLAHAGAHSRAREHLERAASLAPDDPQRWLDLQSLYERSLDLDLAFEARRRAEALAGDRSIEKDWAGFWTVEGADPVP